MTAIRDIFTALCRIAPLELQMDFDNAGFQIGRAEREVHRALLALDATDAVVQEADALGAELIVTHHPLLFSPLRSLTDLDPTQRRALTLVEKGIGLISMHTNLDIAEGGVRVPTLRFVDGGKAVHRIAVMGGAGAGSLECAVKAGCDTYVTADIKYHQFQHAEELKLNLIDADHFYTENPMISELARQLKIQFPDVEFQVSKRHSSCIHFA